MLGAADQGAGRCRRSGGGGTTGKLHLSQATQDVRNAAVVPAAWCSGACVSSMSCCPSPPRHLRPPPSPARPTAKEAVLPSPTRLFMLGAPAARDLKPSISSLGWGGGRQQGAQAGGAGPSLKDTTTANHPPCAPTARGTPKPQHPPSVLLCPLTLASEGQPTLLPHRA